MYLSILFEFNFTNMFKINLLKGLLASIQVILHAKMAMSDLHKGFQGTIVNRALPFLNGGSLEITLPVP